MLAYPQTCSLPKCVVSPLQNTYTLRAQSYSDGLSPCWRVQQMHLRETWRVSSTTCLLVERPAPPCQHCLQLSSCQQRGMRKVIGRGCLGQRNRVDQIQKRGGISGGLHCILIPVPGILANQTSAN